MKKLFTLAAFLFAVAISSSALAANWVYVTTDEDAGYDVYVDKDSIRHGIHSTKCNISRKDGFSAHIDIRDKYKQESLIFLAAFWRENEKKHMDLLEFFDENGNSSPFRSTGTEIYESDERGLALFDYVENNLP